MFYVKSTNLRQVAILAMVVGSLMYVQSASAVDVTTVELTVSPAVAPKPSLKYRLQTALMDQSIGNAATLYLRAMIMLKDNATLRDAATQDKIANFLEMPLSELPRKEVHGILDQAKSVIHEATLGSRRSTCDWELPLREEENPYMILLPEMQEIRVIGRLLALQARMQIAEKRFDEALDTIRVGLTMGRHATEAPLLINGLVGVSIARIMITQVQELERAPGAPNLYWAVTTLPENFIDFRRALETEGAMVSVIFPQLRGIEKAERTDAQWQEDWSKFQISLATLEPLVSNGGQKDDWREVTGQIAAKTWLALTAYPKAKAGLLEFGYNAKQIESMPVGKAILLYTKLTYDDLRDEMFRWFNMPYWQADNGFQESEKSIKAARDREVIPLATLLLPAIANVRVADVRLQRDFAIVRAVEALRLHAAAHAGHLPSKLDQLTIVPVPVDPFTGKPPNYQLDGETATIDYPAPKGRPESEHVKVIVKIRAEK